MSINDYLPEAAPYKHSFSGSFTPAPGSMSGPLAGQVGFSVGVFQWLPKSAGNGLKRGSVRIRVKGFVRDADQVYAKARELCDKLDSGWNPNKKSIAV